jgi:hypothetical protein
MKQAAKKTLMLQEEIDETEICTGRVYAAHGTGQIYRARVPHSNTRRK